MNGYIAMWQGKQVEVYADTAYQAQQLATVEFQRGTRKKVKDYDVNAYLCERNGEQVVHVASF